MGLKRKTKAEPKIETDPENEKGWIWSYPYPKRHYFVKLKSLCGRATIPGPTGLRAEARDRENNCSECMRLLEKNLSWKNSRDTSFLS